MPKTKECPWCDIIEKIGNTALTTETKIKCPNCDAKIKGG
jgi:uncharacterized paraquat-inducible protein A